MSLRLLARWMIPLCATLVLSQPVAGQQEGGAGADATAPAGATPAGVETEEPASLSGPVRITTEISPKEVTVGTPFRYTVRVEADPGVEVFVPLVSGAIGNFVITDYGEGAAAEASNAAAGTPVEIWYELLAYESGSQFVPAAIVGYRAPGGEVLQFEGPKTLVNVDTLLPSLDTDIELRDIKTPVEPPTDWRPALLGLAVLTIILLAVGLIYWLQARRRRGVGGVLRPAHEIALEALSRLRRASLIAEGRHEDYYVRLSSIVREYVEGRFALRAPEMTSEEFLAAVGRSETLGREHRGALRGFLTEADLVKFARHVPSDSDAERAYAAACDFVESTAPRREGAEAREAPGTQGVRHASA